jgi:histidine triad (HIT) family protein
MASIFTKIIQGEIPSYKIAENDKFFAFLDIFPQSKGHTLVVPKQEVDKLFDLDEKTYQELMLFSRKIALAIEKVIPCNRVGVSVIGLEVPHAHVHLIPINTISDMDISQKKLSFTPEEFKEIAQNIRAAFN